MLFTRFLNFDPARPEWPDRDRFVLSAGHGSMLLYALLYLTGVPGVDIDSLKSFRQLGSNTAGHPVSAGVYVLVVTASDAGGTEQRALERLVVLQ